jgi:hypothetical protein
MTRPARGTVVLRTLLVEAMAAAGHPLATDELRQLLPEAVLPWRQDPAVYRNLRALERAGVCRRQDAFDTDRLIVDTLCVYWRYTQDQTFADVLASLPD